MVLVRNLGNSGQKQSNRDKNRTDLTDPKSNEHRESSSILIKQRKLTRNVNTLTASEVDRDEATRWAPFWLKSLEVQGLESRAEPPTALWQLQLDNTGPRC